MGTILTGPPIHPPPPFHDAVKLGFMRRAEGLLEKKADVDTADCRGFTALMHSVQGRSPDMDTIQQLLRWKADPGVADPVYDINSMHIACHFANEHAARLFIDAGVSVNAITNAHQADGVTPLFICVQKGYLSMVSMLLSAKADANIVRASDETSPIHVASQKGYATIVKKLIAKNVTSIETLDRCSLKTNGTAFFAACAKSRPLIAQYLASAKADINKVESRGKLTPLFMAQTLGHTHIIRMLEAMKASVPDYLPNALVLKEGHPEEEKEED